MKTDTEGIVLKETKTSYNRRMIHLLTRDYGKISAGTSLGERGRSRSSLALRHFTFGRYVLHRNARSYNIDSAEVVKSFYGIGENVDKYFNGSYVLEFTEKVLEEDVPAPAVFNLLVDFFDVLESREKGFGTLVLAYQTKLFRYLGVAPELNRCACCGADIDEPFFSIEDGGVICRKCRYEKEDEQAKPGAGTLIYPITFDIIDILKYFDGNSLLKLKNIGLNEAAGRQLQKVIREYAAYHLDASNIKSENMV